MFVTSLQLLVVLALIPATAMSFTLLDRYAGGRLSGATTPQATRKS